MPYVMPEYSCFLSGSVNVFVFCVVENPNTLHYCNHDRHHDTKIYCNVFVTNNRGRLFLSQTYSNIKQKRKQTLLNTYYYCDSPKPHDVEKYETHDSILDDGNKRKRLICRFCKYYITTQDALIVRFGSSRHVFFNPQGQLFELDLFSHAPGCISLGIRTTEFTWFPGYAWQVTLCHQCHAHLGWRYSAIDSTSTTSLFFGLIAGYLEEEQS